MWPEELRDLINESTGEHRGVSLSTHPHWGPTRVCKSLQRLHRYDLGPTGGTQGVLNDKRFHELQTSRYASKHRAATRSHANSRNTRSRPTFPIALAASGRSRKNRILSANASGSFG